jgi:hypothetical protein
MPFQSCGFFINLRAGAETGAALSFCSDLSMEGDC